MTPRIGFTYLPSLPPQRLGSIARAVDAHLDELWVWEDCFAQSGLASAAIALAVTERMRVGLGIMPTPLRNVALCAMEVATLARTFPGRFRPGIGHGVQEWMGQVGARAASPLTLLEEYGVALAALLRGEEVSVAGRYVTLEAVRLAWPPEDPLPLLVGAEGPKTMAVAGRVGDGVISTWIDDATFVRDRELADAARAEARPVGSGGADRAPLEHVCTLVVARGADGADRAAEELRRWFREPSPDMVAVGDAASIAEAIRRRARLGAGTVVLQPTAEEPDLEELIAFVGTQVRPLVRR